MNRLIPGLPILARGHSLRPSCSSSGSERPPRLGCSRPLTICAHKRARGANLWRPLPAEHVPCHGLAVGGLLHRAPHACRFVNRLEAGGPERVGACACAYANKCKRDGERKEQHGHRGVPVVRDVRFVSPGFGSIQAEHKQHGAHSGRHAAHGARFAGCCGERGARTGKGLVERKARPGVALGVA